MTKTLLEDRRTLWFVASLTVLLFAVANLPWQLDDYDQAKQAFTSFQMIKEGRWFYQQTPHEHVATKPPLVGWISAGFFAITGSWDVAWRLPSLLAAIAIAMLLFRAAASAYGAIAGLIALSAFGLNLLSPRLATLVRTDMPLALAIFLIGLLIWQKIRAETEWTRRERIYLFFIAYSGNVDQGPDRLCVSAAGHRHLRMVAIATGAPPHSEAATQRVVWSATGRIRRGELVAMDRFAGCLSPVGNRRDFVYAWFLRSSRDS